MNLSFSIPLQLAWARMERVLLRPFRIRTWLVLGFAAFLSDFLSGRANGSYSWRSRGGDFPHEVTQGVAAFLLHPVLSGIIVTLIVVALIAVVALQWVSCRGRFIFLHNVVEERPGIVGPWRRFARQGDSLFVWTLLFWLACAAIAVALALPFLAGLADLVSGGEFHWAALGAVLGFVAMIVPLALIVAFTLLFLNHFVVPIMYRQGLSATRGWSRFLTVFRAHPGRFVLYGILMLLMWCIVAALVFTVGISTCCVGFVLIGTPYVGQVVLLPIHVLFRGYGPHFLAQFGPEFDAFTGPATDAAAPAPGGTV